MVAINRIHVGLWRHVQQSMEGAQIYNQTKAGSKGKNAIHKYRYSSLFLFILIFCLSCLTVLSRKAAVALKMVEIHMVEHIRIYLSVCWVNIQYIMNVAE